MSRDALFGEVVWWVDSMLVDESNDAGDGGSMWIATDGREDQVDVFLGDFNMFDCKVQVFAGEDEVIMRTHVVNHS